MAIPLHTPALKMPPITWQPVNVISNAVTTNAKRNIDFFILNNLRLTLSSQFDEYQYYCSHNRATLSIAVNVYPL
jgi:hypothetical protein